MSNEYSDGVGSRCPSQWNRDNLHLHPDQDQGYDVDEQNTNGQTQQRQHALEQPRLDHRARAVEGLQHWLNDEDGTGGNEGDNSAEDGRSDLSTAAFGSTDHHHHDDDHHAHQHPRQQPQQYVSLYRPPAGVELVQQEFEDDLTTLQEHIENAEWGLAYERIWTHPLEILPARMAAAAAANGGIASTVPGAPGGVVPQHQGNSLVADAGAAAGGRGFVPAFSGGENRSLNALHIACENGECPPPLVRLILRSLPSVISMPDRHGAMPLHFACSGPYAFQPEIIEMLLRAFPAAVLIQDWTEGATPLHYLLRLGGDVDLGVLGMLLNAAYTLQGFSPRTAVSPVAFAASEMPAGGRAGVPVELPHFGPLLPPAVSPPLPGQDYQPQYLSHNASHWHPGFPSSLPPQQQQQQLRQFPPCLMGPGIAAGLSSEPPRSTPAQVVGSACSSVEVVSSAQASTHERTTNAARLSCPVAPQPTPYLLLRDRNGLTPLHSACYQAAPAPVVSMLLDESAYPGAKSAASQTDKLLRLPLHYAVCYGAPVEVIKMVLSAYIEGAMQPESYKLVPLHLAYMGLAVSNDDRRLELEGVPSNEEQRGSETPSSSSGVGARLLWRKIELLLRAAYTGSVDGDSNHTNAKRFRTVHAAAHFRCPPAVLRCALNLYPFETLTCDENGDLPLHLACTSRRDGGDDELHPWLPQGTNQKSSVYRHLEPEDPAIDNPVSVLLRWRWDAASCPDRQGRLPLNLALEAGKTWINGGIKELVNASPLALNTRDVMTMMFPFMTAAAAAKVGYLNESTTIYELLCANPLALAGGIAHAWEDEKGTTLECKDRVDRHQDNCSSFVSRKKQRHCP